jgi:hypothetical protein
MQSDSQKLKTGSLWELSAHKRKGIAFSLIPFIISEVSTAIGLFTVGETKA